MKGEVTISLEEYERFTKNTNELDDKIKNVLDENLRLTRCLDDKYQSVITLNEWNHFQMSSVAYTNDDATKHLLEIIEKLKKEIKLRNSFYEEEKTDLKDKIIRHIKARKNIFGNVDGDSIIDMLRNRQ